LKASHYLKEEDKEKGFIEKIKKARKEGEERAEIKERKKKC